MSDAQKWLVFGGTIFSGWLLYLLAPILMPFIVGALFAYLGDPLVDRLEKTRLSRTLSVVIVFGTMIMSGLILLLFILPQLERQITGLVVRLPQFISWIQENMLPRLIVILGLEPGSLDLAVVKDAFANNIKDISGIMGRLLVKLTQSGQSLIVWFAYLTLIPVVTFYLLRDWDILVGKVNDLIPRPYEKLVSKLAKQCDEVLAEFLRGQLLVMLAQAVLYSVGLWIVGLEFSLLIGMLAGLVSFVPYLGFIVGIGVAGIAGFMQFHDIIHLVYILIVFGFGQVIEGMILSPLLVGDRIGLHPVAVIFAVMAGGQLFGIVGVLVALPVAAVIVVLLRHVHERYLESNLYTT
ncbi:MAG: AI-2E family transporter [Proteobacteria bacterium]|nr:AI-2E family transporter [Pseudomonadota bacterium]